MASSRRDVEAGEAARVGPTTNVGNRLPLGVASGRVAAKAATVVSPATLTIPISRTKSQRRCPMGSGRGTSFLRDKYAATLRTDLIEGMTNYCSLRRISPSYSGK